MLIGVTKETYPGECRVALIPANVPALAAKGMQVVVETGSGVAAGFADEQYVEKGARIAATRAEAFAADVVLQVRSLGANKIAGRADLALIRAGQTIVGTFDPLSASDEVRAIAETGATMFALELIPRITRAQSMDVLSSQATVAGYRAVILAAAMLPKMFPMLMTAAGTIKPAKVFVIGAGVAGLQAIATAKRLGAVVSAYDVRPAVKDQIESLGAKFVEMPLEAGAAEGEGGYARQMDEAFYRRQRELMATVVAESDAVVATAAVPGQRSPLLITADAVRGMQRGAVIVDLAAERGGNCELSKADETVVEGGVTILGPTNLAAEIPFHASQMYSKNISTFLLHLVKDGKLELDLADQITGETLLARGGQVVNARLLSIVGQVETAKGNV